MKIRLRRAFTYQVTSTQTATLEPGDHDLDAELAGKAIRFGGAKLINEKEAPQNKSVKPAENKARVGRKTQHRGRTGTKSKS